MRALVLATALAGLLPAAAAPWRPLWDGKSLKGWHQIGKGEWTVKGGVLTGRHDGKDGDFGHLVTDAVYKDFTVRLAFKSVEGNSGLYFRIEEKGWSGVSGFQAEIDPRNDVGGLYETNGRAWVVKPTAAQVKEFYKFGDWNRMTLSAHGPRLKVQVNGVTTADINDPKGRRQGRIALQLHGGQDVLVQFKDIEIKGEPVRP
jgi:hypothetical protein